MLKTRTRARKSPPKPVRLSLKDWKVGVDNDSDGNRTPRDGLISSLNQILKQTGTISDRPSRVRYGVQPVGIVLGEITEFTKRTIGLAAVSENYEISVQLVSGTARVYYRKDGADWQLASGKTYNTSAKVHFCPIRDIDANYNDEDKVLILNGKDNLSYLDVNTLTVVPFVTLSTASTPTLTVGSALTSAPNFPQRYRVTAGNRGETAASLAAVVSTNKLRSEWSGATEYVDVTIPRVPNATRYHIYWGTENGQETYLFSVDDPSPHDGTGTVTWRDSGVTDVNTFRPAPAGDTTAGPIGTRASFINGRVWIVGDIANPKYVRYGGVGKSILDFSPYGGGGYEPVGGNKEIPVKVVQFRANGGDPVVTAICKGTSGLGKRYTFSPATLGNISYFAVTEENGSDGTDAPDSVVTAMNQLWYLSRSGVNTTLTKAQIQTILSTERVSDKIQKTVNRFNTQTLDNAVGLEWNDRLYFSVATSGGKNNQMWVLDLSPKRRGAWMGPWEMNVDWMWLYNDNKGVTHFCTLDNNRILEFTDSVASQDDGVGFPSGCSTGLFGFSDDLQDWAEVLRVIFVVSRPQGLLTFGVNGKTEDEPLAALASVPYTAETSVVGWSERPWSARGGWGGIGRIPKTFGIDRTEIEIEVDEELNWLSFDLSAPGKSSYELTDIVVEYIVTGPKR